MLNKNEEKVITDLFQKALNEFENSENFSKDIIISYTLLILSNIEKFYSRQFDIREELYNVDITVSTFYKNLEAYYNDEQNALKMPSFPIFRSG